MTDVVLYRELESVSGKKIAVATLNSERSLNALSLAMVESLTPKLLEWQQDDSIAMVILEGAGDKAFCAGGDIVDIYHAMKAQPGEYAPQVEAFFTEEYKLDYLIHTYDKPILLWGNGIVMGGGLGLMAGASHRVVTESARIAMPEITIGLYPDVGGTWFLNRMPGNCGLFLGLTGASINAADAKHVQLADFFVKADAKQDLIEQLVLVKWGDTQALNHQKLSDVLKEFEQQSLPAMPQSVVSQHLDLIDELTAGDDLSTIVNQIVEHKSEQTAEDKWFLRAQASLAHGSPLSAYMVYEQLQQGQALSLEDCFRFELGLSVQCGQLGEFAEGIRALLIEKDRQPKWLFNKVEDISAEVREQLFTSPWASDAHPLRGLGH